ncbi:hypothetical protein HG530_015206 [Fusarium avenaceum]|nr:hypothetical protein HG530_015206 [Fusarium avenaceum]
MTDLITKVGVDADELTTVDSEVHNVDVTASVVLDELVGSLVGTASNDVGSSTTLDSDGILADVLKPDELEVTGTKAVNALLLVGTNDDIAKGSTILEDEDSILLT